MVSPDGWDTRPRWETLAAEILRVDPELRQAAQRTETYELLDKHARRLTIDGLSYVVLEGDLVLDSDETLLYALEKAQEHDDAPDSPGAEASALVGIAANNQLVRWPPDVILRYCVLRVSFPEQWQYEEICANLVAATAAWEDACGVRFEHVSQYDDHPDPTTPARYIESSLVFSVRYIDAGGAFIAAAFFPTQPPQRRRILIDPSYFVPGLQYDKVGVLRHEIGHVLGFRHEHVRSGAPAECPDESRADMFDLTAYDPQSVMHYFCGGVGSRDLQLTDIDKEGAQRLYGPSRKTAGQ